MPLHLVGDCAQHGAKAVSLAWLHACGLPVPPGMVIAAATPDHALPQAVDEVAQWGRHRAPYGLIVRPSAPAHSPDLGGLPGGPPVSRFTPTEPEALLRAVVQVRDSARPAAAAEQRVPPGMAVLVQAALRPYAAGTISVQTQEGRCQGWRAEARRGLALVPIDAQRPGEVHTGTADLHEGIRPGQEQGLQVPAHTGELALPAGATTALGDVSGGTVRATVTGNDGATVRLQAPPDWQGTQVLSQRHCERLRKLATRTAALLPASGVHLEWVLTPDGCLHVLQARALAA